MNNSKEQIMAEMCKEEGLFKAPDFGSVLNLEADYEGLTKKYIEANCTNSEADQATVNNLNLKEEHHMTREEFWAIINSTLEAKDRKEQLELIRKELLKLSDAELVAYNNIFTELTDELYGWPLWGAGRIMLGFCSDDGFTDFRRWVVSKGQSAYENALNNPDSLAEVITQRDIYEGASFEEFGYIANRIYEERTGGCIWAVKSPSSEQSNNIALGNKDEILIDDDFYEEFYRNMGEGWDFDDLHEMYRRYPKLLPKFFESYLRLKFTSYKGKWVLVEPARRFGNCK